MRSSHPLCRHNEGLTEARFRVPLLGLHLGLALDLDLDLEFDLEAPPRLPLLPPLEDDDRLLPAAPLVARIVLILLPRIASRHVLERFPVRIL